MIQPGGALVSRRPWWGSERFALILTSYRPSGRGMSVPLRYGHGRVVVAPLPEPQIQRVQVDPDLVVGIPLIRRVVAAHEAHHPFVVADQLAVKLAAIRRWMLHHRTDRRLADRGDELAARSLADAETMTPVPPARAWTETSGAPAKQTVAMIAKRMLLTPCNPRQQIVGPEGRLGPMDIPSIVELRRQLMLRSEMLRLIETSRGRPRRVITWLKWRRRAELRRRRVSAERRE
ncbi:hypothetical protein Q2941_49900 [Bradyrhizobium sp. UFLA05-153]